MNIEAQAQLNTARGGPPKQVGAGAPRGGRIPRHQGWTGIGRAHKTARIISDTPASGGYRGVLVLGPRTSGIRLALICAKDASRTSSLPSNTPSPLPRAGRDAPVIVVLTEMVASL